MSLAEEMAFKHGFRQTTGGETIAIPLIVELVNEALERAAMECEAVGEQYGIRAGTPKECAARIRALKGA